MKTNVGSVDKTIRFIIALVFIILYVTGVVSGALGIVLLVVAAILILTGLVGFCGLYLPFGISTCKKKG